MPWNIHKEVHIAGVHHADMAMDILIMEDGKLNQTRMGNWMKSIG
ncbi:hypothetical protein QUF94_14330 [Peribacillus sp. NJ4]|nr:hypothetical protein [Peribacillus sp. NJ4]MDM5212603.1 hypothetical protein [Peribacillus sp. NJ4]